MHQRRLGRLPVAKALSELSIEFFRADLIKKFKSKIMTQNILIAKIFTSDSFSEMIL